MSTKFYLRNPSAESETSITVRARWKDNTLVYSTGKKVTPSDWNPKTSRVRKSVSNYSTLNSYLEREIILIRDGLVDFEKNYGKSPDAKQFKKYLADYRVEVSPKDVSALEEPKYTFYSLIDLLIEQHTKRLKNEGKELKHGTYCTTLKQTSNVLKQYQSDQAYKIDFDSIDLDFYYGFVEWCYTVKGYSVNNTGKHVKTVKRIMNEANELELTDNLKHKSKKFIIPKEKVYNVYLNEIELDELFRLDLSNQSHLSKARDLFLVGCWTGLRISDVKRVKEQNIISKDYIKIRTQKTEKEVEIPLNGNLKATLENYNYRLPSMPDQNLNDYIKIVCLKAGIVEPQTYEVQKNRKKVLVTKPKFEMVSSHTARRSFATNRYEEGLDVITIMAITGHTTQTSFMTYIKTQPKTFRKKLSEHYIKQGKHLKVV